MGPVPEPIVIEGEPIRHISVGQIARFDLSAPGCDREDLEITVTGPAKQPVAFRLISAEDVENADASGSTVFGIAGNFRVEFSGLEVGTYLVDVVMLATAAAKHGVSTPPAGGYRAVGSPFLAKVYDASLIRVSDPPNGVVGSPCQFRVDASQAGEGQLEISICDGEVPNHVQVLGGGRCLVSFIPEKAMEHNIDIKFNGDTVPGCPFFCQVTDTSRVKVNLRHLELIPIDEAASFMIHVDGTTPAELGVSVRAPSMSTLPVKVSGTTRTGFRAEFVPKEVGAHTVLVEYNGTAVAGTPFTAKVYDSKRVYVSPLPRGAIGKALQFTVDAGQAGEGNLEITISAGGRNIPTQVHPQGNARFAVSFVPLEACDHVITISFNKEDVSGSPFIAHVAADPNRLLVSGQGLASAAVGKPAYFTISNVTAGTVEDIEVNVEGPTGSSVPAQLTRTGDGSSFLVEYAPRVAGEHRVHVLYAKEAVPGSPFSCKVYDVTQIKVRESTRGVVGRPVTFLVETSQAGPGNLEVTVNQGQVPTSAQSQGHHTYAISFTPKEPKTHVVELKFNGEDVPGSPFQCAVLDASRVTASGDGLDKVPVGQPATFYIHSQESGGDLVVVVTGPSRGILPHVLTPIGGEGGAKFTVSYSPEEVGDHAVDIRYAELPIPGSPFLVKAYDAGKINVTDIGSGVVGKPVYFNIDASHAGAGNLEIIVSVNGRNVPNYVQSEGNAKFRVNFKPQEPAVHLLSVRFNGESVPGSPFSCRVTDSSLVLVTGEGLKMASVARMAQFSIDPRGTDIAGCAVVITSPTNLSLPVTLEHMPTGLLRASFQPDEVGPHQVSLTMAGGEHLGASPYTCNVYDVNKVRVTGLENSKVGRPVTFTVDASEAGEGTLELVVTTAKTSVKAEVVARSRGLYDVTFIPQEPIPHFVNITFNEEEVAGNPFKCQVRDLDAKEMKHLKRTESKMVSVAGDGLREVVVGAPSRFQIDTKGMDGDVDVRVTGPDEESIPCRVLRAQNGSSGLYRAEYRPEVAGLYKIQVFHRNQIVSKQPFLVEAADPARVKLLPPQSDENEDNEDDSRGNEDDDPVTHKRHGRRRPTGSAATVGRDVSFRVDASKAGRGSLTVSIKAAGQEVKHSLRDLGWGCYDVVFTPSVAVPHRVTVKYNGVAVPPIAGATSCSMEIDVKNPYAGKVVTASGLGLHQSRVGKPTTFVIETLARSEHFSDSIDVWVTGPSGSAVPVKCYQQKDGNLLAEFNAVTAGAHKIDVTNHNVPIHGSPFTCQVFDAAKVRIEELTSSSSPVDAQNKPNKPTTPGVFSVNDRIAFRIDRRRAGIAELNVTVSSPVGKHLPVEVKPLPDGRGELIEFAPPAAGKYKIAVTYGDDEVPGSPVTFSVEDGAGWARAFGEGLARGRVGSVCGFKIDARGLIGEPHVVVDGPDSVAKSRVDAVKEDADPDGATHVATYTPQEVGVFDVTVQWNGKELPGSPFHPKIVDPKKVRVIGGWESFSESQPGTDAPKVVKLVVNEEIRIPFDVSDAGPGKLRADIKYRKKSSGQREQLIPVENVRVEQQSSPSRYRLCFTPMREGEHLLYLFWADFPIPNSPVFAYADDLGKTPQVGSKKDAAGAAASSAVVLRGHGLANARCGEQAEFVIDGSSVGTGTPEVSLTGIKTDIRVQLQQLGPDGGEEDEARRKGLVWRATYTPSVCGAYLLNVTWSGRQVKGCPLKVNVMAMTDANKVLVTGEGIKGGVVGRDVRSLIDTRRAGPGELTAHCAGPNKVAYCELYDHGDGTFLLNVKPQEAGKHSLTIKYGGEHVPGSPFVLKISGAPDPSKVRVFGPGVEPGVLANFQSRFVCDTRGAGAGQLTVRIRGPKAAFRVEMQRDGQKDRCISCRYSPTEPGDYRVEVKWSGDHVPGSPFMVMIFDTEEELRRFIRHGRADDPASPASAMMGMGKMSRAQSPGVMLQAGMMPRGGPAFAAPGSEYYGSGYATYGPVSPSSWRGSQPHL